MFGRGERPRFFHHHTITNFVLTGGFMSGVAFAGGILLTVLGMGERAVDTDDNRFRRFSRDDDSDQMATLNRGHKLFGGSGRRIELLKFGHQASNIMLQFAQITDIFMLALTNRKTEGAQLFAVGRE